MMPALVINEVDADQVGTDSQEFVGIYDGVGRIVEREDLGVWSNRYGLP
jgi:hypothetical protein